MKLTLSGGRDSELLLFALVRLALLIPRPSSSSLLPKHLRLWSTPVFHLPQRQSSASIDRVQPCFSGYPHSEPPGRIHRASLFDRRLGYKVAASFCASETAQSAPLLDTRHDTTGILFFLRIASPTSWILLANRSPSGYQISVICLLLDLVLLDYPRDTRPSTTTNERPSLLTLFPAQTSSRWCMLDTLTTTVTISGHRAAAATLDST